MTKSVRASHNQVLRASASTSTRAAADRISRVWDRADDETRQQGAAWYPTARAHADEIARLTGHDLVTVVVVIAHLSPRTSWKRNIEGARSLLTGGDGHPCMRANVARARAAVGDWQPLMTLRGPKISSFAINILGDGNEVTVDSWAARLAFGLKGRDAGVQADKVLSRVGVYDAVAHSYRVAARRYGVRPDVMQAATWLQLHREQWNSPVVIPTRTMIQEEPCSAATANDLTAV